MITLWHVLGPGQPNQVKCNWLGGPAFAPRSPHRGRTRLLASVVIDGGKRGNLQLPQRGRPSPPSWWSQRKAQATGLAALQWVGRASLWGIDLGGPTINGSAKRGLGHQPAMLRWVCGAIQWSVSLPYQLSGAACISSVSSFLHQSLHWPSFLLTDLWAHLGKILYF